MEWGKAKMRELQRRLSLAGTRLLPFLVVVFLPRFCPVSKSNKPPLHPRLLKSSLAGLKELGKETK